MRHVRTEHLVALLLSIGVALSARGGPALASTRSNCSLNGPSQALFVGMSTSLSGPVRAVGEAMMTGVQAYFASVNRSGGVDGRRLCLIALDDSYDPPTAAANTRELVANRKILAILGAVGTPTAKVSLPIATAGKMLYFGALSGSSILRTTPPNPYVINFRASYDQEITAMVNGLLSIGIKPDEIAVFAQNDAYGDAGYQGTVKALAAHGDKAAAKTLRGNYTRNTMAVEDALITLIESPVPPKAIIMVGAYAPSAKFIRLARKVFRAPLLLNLSFVNGTALRQALGSDAEGTIVTQVVPPIISKLPAIGAYRRALAEFAPRRRPNDISLEGYLVARIFVAGLRRAGPHPSRQNITGALLGLHNLDIGMGVKVNFGPNNRQASLKVWPTIIHNGIFTPLKWDSLAVNSR